MTNYPPVHVSEWLSGDKPLMLDDFRGRVLAILVLQMLFPGCVSHRLAQAQRIAATFDPTEVAVDAPGTPGPLPHTMAALGLQGTPRLVLIDRQGQMRARHFGQVSDMALGAEIMALVQEPRA